MWQHRRKRQKQDAQSKENAVETASEETASKGNAAETVHREKEEDVREMVLIETVRKIIRIPDRVRLMAKAVKVTAEAVRIVRDNREES